MANIVNYFKKLNPKLGRQVIDEIGQETEPTTYTPKPVTEQPRQTGGYIRASHRTPGTTTPETVTPDSIYQQKMSLAERLASEQRRLAETQANYKRQSLQEQLEQQRRQYAQQLSMMNEQYSGRGNQLLQGLADRGLATSGLLQLGDVQTQMAKGQGLSELAYQDRMAREGVSSAEQQVRGDLFNALRQAELDKAGYETGALEQLYGMQQQETAQEQQKSYNTLQQIYSAFELIKDPNLDDNTKSLLMNAIGLAEQGDNTALQEILTDPTFAETVGGQSEEIIEKNVLGGSFYSLDNRYANAFITNKKTSGKIDLSQFWNAGNASFDFNGAQNYLQNMYENSNLDGKGDITVDLSKWSKGFSSNKIFKTKYNTYHASWNDALEKIKEIAGNG